MDAAPTGSLSDMSKRRKSRNLPSAAKVKAVDLNHSEHGARAWLKVAASKAPTLAIGVLVGMIAGFLGHFGWGWYSRPRLVVRYAVAILREKGELKGDSTHIYVTLDDVMNGCVAMNVHGTAPMKDLGTLPPAAQVIAKLLIYNVGRSPATDVGIGFAFEGMSGDLEIESTPNFSIRREKSVPRDVQSAKVDRISIETVPAGASGIVTFRETLDPEASSALMDRQKTPTVRFPFVGAKEVGSDSISLTPIGVQEVYEHESDLYGGSGPRIEVPFLVTLGGKVQFTAFDPPEGLCHEKDGPRPSKRWNVNVIPKFTSVQR